MQEITRIPLEGAHNTRDLGGFLTTDGRRIRKKRLLRSGELNGLTERDAEILVSEYDLRTVIDFRTAREMEEKPDVRLPGVTVIANPILEEQTMGITRELDEDKNVVTMVADMLKGRDGSEAAGEAYMAGLYSELVTNDFSRRQYRRFFDLLLDQEDGAVLWHCSAGKDRVGTGTMLLLNALGVPRDQIMADYLKVNEFAREGVDRIVLDLVKKTGDERTARAIRTLFSVHESYLESVYETIRSRYGSMSDFLNREMGLSGERLDRLKQLYLEENT